MHISKMGSRGTVNESPTNIWPSSCKHALVQLREWILHQGAMQTGITYVIWHCMGHIFISGNSKVSHNVQQSPWEKLLLLSLLLVYITVSFIYAIILPICLRVFSLAQGQWNNILTRSLSWWNAAILNDISHCLHIVWKVATVLL